MKVLKCRDIGERTCNFEANGESTEDVERKWLDHANERHKDFIQGMSQEDMQHLFKHMDAMVEKK